MSGIATTTPAQGACIPANAGAFAIGNNGALQADTAALIADPSAYREGAFAKVATAFAETSGTSTQRTLRTRPKQYRNIYDLFFVKDLQGFKPLAQGWTPFIRTPYKNGYVVAEDLSRLAKQTAEDFPGFQLPFFTFRSETKAELAAKFLATRAIGFANQFLPFTELLKTTGTNEELMDNFLVAEEFMRFLFFVQRSRTNDELVQVLLRVPEQHRSFAGMILAGDHASAGTIVKRGETSLQFLQALEELSDIPWLNEFVNGTLFIDIEAFEKLFPQSNQYVSANGGDLSKPAQISMNLRRMGNRWLDMMTTLSSAELPAHLGFPKWVSDKLRMEPVGSEPSIENMVTKELLTTIPHSSEAKTIAAGALGKFLYLAVATFNAAHHPLENIELSLEELYIIRKLFRSKFRETLAILNAGGMTSVDETLFERCMKRELARYMLAKQDVFPIKSSVISELVDFFTKGRQEA